MKELEAVIWCPKCAAEKARVFRVESNGIGVNVTEPDSMTGAKECPDCQTGLVGQR